MQSATSRAPRRPYGTSNDDLLAAAAQCIAERGFDGTRLRDVAQKAGVSIGSVQYHFATRDELLTAAFRWSCDELVERWRSRADSTTSTPWEKLEALIDEQTSDPSLIRHCTTWTEFCASATRHGELREIVADVYAAWRAFLANIIDEGIAAGQFWPELGTADLVDLFNATIDGFEMATAVGAGLLAPERFRALTLTLAISLLRPTGQDS